MMIASNVHGTAVVVGTKGLLFFGPSGIGKSSLAFACINAARLRGLYSALVADDQILLSSKAGQIVGEAPASIAGMIEIRGTGILTIAHVSPALLHYAVRVVDLAIDDRLPPKSEHYPFGSELSLPVIRLSKTSFSPLDVLLVEISSSA